MFDFDGTLIDSTPILLKFLTALNKKFAYGSPLQHMREKQLPRFVVIIAVIRIALFRIPLIGSFLAQFHPEKQNIQPIPGIITILRDFSKQANYVLMIASTNSKENIEKALKTFNMEYFNAIEQGSLFRFQKHAILKHLLKRFSLQKEQIIYIGDEIRDVLAAKQLGLANIAVTWGFNTEHSLAQTHPDALARTPDELLSNIQQIIAYKR